MSRLTQGLDSMFPLLKRDGQGLQYLVTTLLWNYMVGYNPLRVVTTWVRRLGLVGVHPFYHTTTSIQGLTHPHAEQLVYPSLLAIHFAELVLSPPARYPDLYAVLNVLLSCGVFGCVWLWANRRLVEEGWAMGAGAGAGFGAGPTRGPGVGHAGTFPVVNGKRKVM